MDNLELLRLVSVVVLVCWSAAAAGVVPLLWGAHPRRHPLLLLLLALSLLEVLEAALFVDTAFTARHARDGRAFADVMALRVVSIATASVMFGTLWHVARRG